MIVFISAIVWGACIIGAVLFTNKRRLLLVAILASASTFAALSLSLFLSFDGVENRDDLKSVELGWPISVIRQNQERIDPPFPYRAYWIWEATSNEEKREPVKILWKGLAGAFVLYGVAILVLIWGVRVICRKVT